MTSSTRPHQPAGAATDLAPKPGPGDPAAADPAGTLDSAGTIDEEAVGFDPDSSGGRRLPEGHADARVAVAPDAFAPPGADRADGLDPDPAPAGGARRAAAGGARRAAAGGADGAGGQPGPAPGGTRAGRHPALALAVRSWRQLTSMRTALVLLFLLALAAVPGSLLPQRNINPMRVDQYLSKHQTLGPLLDKLSGFDVFAAPWFAAIYLLLFISLIGCLSSRIRWHARALFTAPPKAPARPGRLPGGSAWTSPLAPADATAAARAALRRRRFRASVARAGTRRPDGSADHSVAAEKGYLRETGNLVFHVALVGLLAAVGFGSWFGYQGTTLVVTGDSMANTIISYDQFSGGKLVDTAKLRPFSLTLNRFAAAYEPNGEPSDFRADVTYSPDLDAPTRQATIRVNHPLVLGNAKIYLIGHGYAPHFVLRDARGRTVWQGNVPCTPRDGMFTSTCTVKIPDTGLAPLGVRKEPQQLAFSGVFTPTTHLDPTQGYVSTFPAARAPGLTITGFVGNLHLDEGVPQNVYTVDTRDMRQLTLTGPAGAARNAQVLAVNNPRQRTLTGLPGGLSLEADSVAEFATFQVKSDPFKREALIFAVLIIVGLIASLRVHRRRLWVRASPAPGGGSVVEIGGLSRSHGDGFVVELGQLTTLVREATGPTGGRDPAPSAGSPGSPGSPESAGPAAPSGAVAPPDTSAAPGTGAAAPGTTESRGTAAGGAASNASEREH
ncbi:MULTISPECIES: cytochrome c biogenesis protein ResB [Frankia]|uniref:Cytochrome C biogenesis membrane protein n=1 Tax=Frankia alni (strain DSM 45986 / CECT 9034 / ACN14a) TaxID=326424 RepID=Q0RRZ7_FRAAA|nr:MULTISPECIES: cytochrome c biogenesis protein ResB [Frankia]CAJ59668.1 putative cytochrome C biogenesis membrane protein [Frankia alni ACN14a]